MSRVGRCARLFAALLLMLVGSAAVGATSAHAATEQITVSLYRVVEISCDEGDGEACGNDYYPKFEIDHQGLIDGKDDYCCAHGADFRTNWVRTATVDTSHNPVAIHLELWDQDDLSADDPVRWVGESNDLNLSFDLMTCTFTGGGLTGQQGAGVPTLAGESEGPVARGYFTITTPSCVSLANSVDSDGDGLMNTWEVPGRGYDFNTDGTVDLPLGDQPYGAVPYRKDLFVEADYMAETKPQADALADVVKAFAEAPVDPYPDPADATKTKFRGVNLHVTEGEAVTTVNPLMWRSDGPGTADDFNDLKSGSPRGPCTGFFGLAADRSSPNCANILSAKRQAFRYMLFAISFFDRSTPPKASTASGSSEWTPVGPQGGNDFIVTLDTWDSSTIEKIGARRKAEAATFMHELGHTLSLGHGGNDAVNCKPNYLSVMNYTLQFAGRDPARPLDYSSAARGTALGTAPATVLNEASLNENNGVYGTPSPARNTVYGVAGKLRVAPATNGPINWNETGGDKESAIPADINYIQSIGPDDGGCSKASPGQSLGGFDDWAHIQYNPRLNAEFFADGDRPLLPELTEESVRAMFQQADLKIAKSADEADATGGDTVHYTTTVTDLGPGTATGIHVDDTLPDGSTQQRSLVDLANGATATVTPAFTYLVPCDTADGTVLTNRATVTGTDTEGVPDPYTDDNTARATTTVHAPVLTVDKAATATVDAGQAITYTLTYANTGSGAASGVTLTDTLPAGVYYSQALDLGTGPRPSSVTLNDDGTRTLVWNVGSLPAHSGDRQIVFTARPTLLALAGTTYTDTVSVGYKNAGGACTFAPVTDSATTTVTVTPPSRDPLSQGYWRNHPGQWTAEFLARVQATDQRYDTDRSGALSAAEVTAAFRDDNAPKSILGKQLLAVYFNLATRRINAGTAILSRTTQSLGVHNVREAVIYAQDTLLLPVNSGTAQRYSRIIGVLDDINANRIEQY
ncbi:DUF7507 domain-containing protein [Streptomyces exfoliatus]|uniref:DUF7507 domain-containing protein n=1 Tax=Streptomyces exfoliatus TaxID=1905 RepID=UPI0004AD7E38|nr:DUF11 domain-containing protein [Streptomyces exfoliatus]